MFLEQNQFTLRMVMMYEDKENGDTHTHVPPPKKMKNFSHPSFCASFGTRLSLILFFFFFWREQREKGGKKRAYGEMARAPKEVENKIGRGWKINEDWTPQKPAHPLLAPNPTPIQSSLPFLKFEPGSPTLFLFHASTRSLFAYWQLHKASSLPPLFHAEQQGVCSPLPILQTGKEGKRTFFFLPIS